MNDAPRYQTTLSGRVRRSLILNGVGAAILCALSGPQWFSGGHWLHGVVFCVMAPLAVLAGILLVRSRHPLEVYSDRIVTNSLLSTSLPLSQIEGIGTHPRRDEPCLMHRDEATGQTGPIPIHWRFIAEPQDEVVAEIRNVLTS